MHTFVPDTNFFLQCRDYQDLDWGCVTADSDILIAVPRAVQREIDRHKDGGNSRRASRARKANALFAQVLNSVDNTLLATTTRGSIRIELLMQRIRQEDFADLDLQGADDQIVAEALLLMRARPSDAVTFLSNDTPALMTARAHDLRYVRLPSDWMLHPEKDDRDKTIEELRRKLERLSNQQPQITFKVADLRETQITTEVTFFPALSDAEIDSVVAEISRQYPMETHFPKDAPARFGDPLHDRIASVLNPFEKWRPASPQEIEDYQTNVYPKWLKQVRSELATIEHRLNEGLLTTFSLVVENSGQQPAKNLLVSCVTQGEIVFGVPTLSGPRDQSVGDTPLLSSPPGPPAGKFVDTAEEFLALHSFSPVRASSTFGPLRELSGAWDKESRDPNSLYWKPSRPSEKSTSWTLECSEFRHLHEPFLLEVRFRPTSMTEGTVSGAVRCAANASNLPERVEFTVPVRVAVARGDTTAYVRKTLFQLS